MQGVDQGIIVSQPQLDMLLAFADPESKSLNCVTFETEINTVIAYSLDGWAGIIAIGDNDGFRREGHQWRVELEFLEAVKKALKAKDYARLEFSGDSITQAVRLELLENGGEPVLEDRQTIRWPQDACIHQTEFDFANWRDFYKPLSNDKGVPQELSPRYLRRLKGFESMGSGPVVQKNGRAAKDGATFEARLVDNSIWTMIVKPRSAEPKSRKPKNDRQAGLPGVDGGAEG